MKSNSSSAPKVRSIFLQTPPWLLCVGLFSACSLRTGNSLLEETDLPPQRALENVSLDVNDVSFLFPLPQAISEINNLLPIEDATQDIEMLSSARLKELEESLGATDHDQQVISNQRLLDMTSWRVVALRIDPCAKDAVTESSCRFEFRLVLQQIFPAATPSDRIVLNDQAIHLIYELNGEESKSVISEIFRIKREISKEFTAGRPLGQHPILLREAGHGPATSALNDIIKKYSRNSRLSAVAVMSQRDRGQLSVQSLTWSFIKARVLEDGTLKTIEIPGIESPVVTLKNGFAPGLGSIFGMSPEPENTDNAAKLLNTRGLDADTLNQSVDAALRLTNPQKHTPSTTDCVSCHTASTLLTKIKGEEFLVARDGNSNRFIPPSGPTFTFSPSGDLASASSVRNIRAFGYTPDGQPSVMAFTAYESAMIADFLNKNFGEAN